MFSPTGLKNNIVLTRHGLEGLNLYLLIDAHRVTQILINLLSNALKFTPSGGHVQVIAKFQEHSENPVGILSISVIDSGPGMSSSELSRLFERFSQANQHVSTHSGGSGLGLHISKSLAQLMNGKLSVSSTVGVGSTFDITIPAERISFHEQLGGVLPSPDTLASSDEKQSSVPEPSSVSILVAEDNSINQRILQNILLKSGYSDVEIVENGKEALSACIARPRRVILMDLEMPVMGGIAAMRELRRREAQQRQGTLSIILGVSGHTSSTQINQALASGMNGFITKPYTPSDVINTIQRFLQ
jgi:CheY-like chemotaxis protein